ncbi:MAG: integrase core domain-containing protein [Luteolibacter sp.]
MDDHSRFNLLLEACKGETLGGVRPLLEQAFAVNGLPAAILCDNGSPWGDSCGFFTRFEVWLMRLGVRVCHGRPRHPQTQGKEERFHRTLKAEVLSRTTVWRDLSHCQDAFRSWREIYNHERRHESLGG